MVIFMLVLIPGTYAAGITSPYWDTKPLTMKPGETVDVELTLQNMVGGDDLTFVGSITQGADIVSITDTIQEYKVPFGEKNVPVHLRVSLPLNALPSDQPRTVAVSFKQITKQEGGMVQLGTGIQSTFPVLVEAPPAAAAGGESPFSAGSPSNLIVPVIALLAVALIVGIVMARRRIARKRMRR